MSSQEVSSQETAVSQERTVIEGCGYADYSLPSGCGGEVKHLYGYGAIVALCDGHHEIAPDPRLITGWSEDEMLLLCKAWREKDHHVLAKFAKHMDPMGRYYYYDREGKSIEYHSDKEDVLQDTIDAYRNLAFVLRDIILNGLKPEAQKAVAQSRTRLANLGKTYANIDFEEKNLHPERLDYRGFDTPERWRFPGLDEESSKGDILIQRRDEESRSGLRVATLK